LLELERSTLDLSDRLAAAEAARDAAQAALAAAQEVATCNTSAAPQHAALDADAGKAKSQVAQQPAGGAQMGMLAAFVTGGANEAGEGSAAAEVQKLKVALDNVVAAKAAMEARLEAQVGLMACTMCDREFPYM
jgi:hypothetical protein